MAIDRIGKGGGLPPTPDASAPQGTGSAAPTGAKFEIDAVAPAERKGATSATSAASATSPTAMTPLARLRAGEIDVHGYIDLKVDEATAPLKGLSAVELADVKSMLRDQLRSDPGTAELVRSATGAMPQPPED